MSAFMRHFGFGNAVKKKLIPKYTGKVVAAYTGEELKVLFSACGQEGAIDVPVGHGKRRAFGNVQFSGCQPQPQELP